MALFKAATTPYNLPLWASKERPATQQTESKMIDNLNTDELIPTMRWWNKRRIKYNIGLIKAGFLAFICYALVVQFMIIPKDINAEITLFTTLFQGIGYIFMILIANLFYFFGPISERLIMPDNIDKFRERTFRLCYWFSFVLPFSIPVTLIIINL